MGLALGVPTLADEYVTSCRLRLLPVEPDPTSIGVGMSVEKNGWLAFKVRGLT